jgi:uncharacterized delta-60 repeat protein
MWLAPLSWMSCVPPTPPITKDPLTTETGTSSSPPAPDTSETAESGDTGPADTGTVAVPGPPPLPIPDVLPWGELDVPLSGLYPDVTDLAVAEDGGLCLIGSSWFEDIEDQYVAGPAYVLRIGPDGSPDSAFGIGGWVTLEGTTGGWAVAAAPGGGCDVVVGLGYAGDSWMGGEQAQIVRLDAAGAIDPSFVSAPVDHGEGLDKIYEIVALEGGGLLALGASSEAYVHRFLSDGSLDPTFGDAGQTILPVPGGVRRWASMGVLADGGVLAWSGDPAQVVRLRPDGLLDTNYGTAGVASSSGTFPAYGTGHWPDGSLTLFGFAFDGSSNVPHLETFDPLGSSSVVSVPLPGEGGFFYAATGDTSGRIIAGGYMSDPHSPQHGGALLRMEGDALDPTFGTAGILSTPWVSAYAVVTVAGNGTLLAAGAGSLYGAQSGSLVIQALAP